MNQLDIHYLKAQFYNRIYKKNGTEFQGFFEDIMEKAFPDFKKIKPCGAKGDAGNDGFREEKGIYYQVYSPETPKILYSKAAKKLKEDFEKLKKGWNQISSIREYYFVFNDKYDGSAIELEQAKSELKETNKNIEFKIFIAKDLEDIFFSLKKSDILNLNFNIDSTKAFSNACELLDKIEIDLDRENGIRAFRTLEIIKEIIFSFKDEKLELEYEILECRCWQKLEKIEEAKLKYENLSKRFPDDPRPYLHLAEIHLNDEDFNENERLLEKVEKIDSKYWFLGLERLLRNFRLGNKLNLSEIDENALQIDPRIKSNFYRLYSLFFDQAELHEKSDSFIEKAINCNPEKFSNYYTKLSILGNRIFSSNDIREKTQDKLEKFLNEINNVEEKFQSFGDIGNRNIALLNSLKLNIFVAQENLKEFENLAKDTFALLITCYFDKLIDDILENFLKFVELPQKDFDQLLGYLKQSKKTISYELAKVIVSQFIYKNKLFKEGKKYFEEINKNDFLSFINNVEDKNYDKAWTFLKDDIPFAVVMSNMLKSHPILRKNIIKNLPDDNNLLKEKLLLLLNYDEGNIDEAFQLLQNFDLSTLSYFECMPMLRIAQEKKAWDFEITILTKLLEHEKDEKVIFDLELQLFIANRNLKKYPEVTKIGNNILLNSAKLNFLSEINKEIFLGNTISAYLKRGKFLEAKELLERFSYLSQSFEFKVGIEADVYLKNNKPKKALESVIKGVKTKKRLLPEEYAGLFFILNQIKNSMKIDIKSLKRIENGSFVKVENQENWYFIGDENELDAIKITSSSKYYSHFINKKVGEKINFTGKYSSEKEEKIIENILTIDRYIFWQCDNNFNLLSREERLDGTTKIEVSEKDGQIDLQYLNAFFEDMQKEKEPFYEMYCKGNVPLSLLAVLEGGLSRALGWIQKENRGFVNFSSGARNELDQQKKNARSIIDGMPFYLDATSALILAETGFLKKVYDFVPNLKVPQSVISFLLETVEEFRFVPGQGGYMGYAQGKITVSSFDHFESGKLQNNFRESISLLESKPGNIQVISLANKLDCISEQKIPAELCDACILAQKENIYVMTEDFLYLEANKLETKKDIQGYCSALSLVRVLYEQKKLSFEEYLDFFSYLSSRRFRFLSLNIDDIENAVFGGGIIKFFEPKNIRKLNFSLTLSEEYGISFKTAFNVVGKFLYKILIDDAIPHNYIGEIFIEILSTFPSGKNKKGLGEMLLNVCVQEINKTAKKIIFNKTNIRKKIKTLEHILEIHDFKSSLWFPSDN